MNLKERNYKLFSEYARYCKELHPKNCILGTVDRVVAIVESCLVHDSTVDKCNSQLSKAANGTWKSGVAIRFVCPTKGMLLSALKKQATCTVELVDIRTDAVVRRIALGSRDINNKAGYSFGLTTVAEIALMAWRFNGIPGMDNRRLVSSIVGAVRGTYEASVVRNGVVPHPGQVYKRALGV